MIVSEKIKVARRLAGITQKSLAEATGLNIRQVQAYESGERNAKIENLKKIADALKIEVWELLS